jgi:hypothetical protein
MPAMVSVAAVEAAKHEAPVRAMMTLVPDFDPAALHEPNPTPVVMAGVVGMVKPAGKLAVTVDEFPSDPLAELVKPTVQVVVWPAT